MQEANDRTLRMANNNVFGLAKTDGEEAAAASMRQRRASHRKIVETLEHELSEAGNLFGGRVIAPAILSALTMIEQHALPPEAVRLSWNDRDNLMALLMRARENILDLVREDQGPLNVAFAASSLDAACVMLICWCDADRCDRPPGFLNEIGDRVRYLINIFDNIRLQDRFERTFSSSTSNGTHAKASEARCRHG